MENINKSVVFVGMMGCGKSSIGKMVAFKLGIPFADLDNYIERKEGMNISELFATKGEAYFRQQELICIKELLASGIKVIALGGGAYINKEIRELLKENAITIWIRASLDIILERVSRKNTRPLLENVDKKQVIAKLMDERYPVYAEADISVDTNDGVHEVLVEKIYYLLRDKFRV